jgi:hypothetical protein
VVLHCRALLAVDEREAEGLFAAALHAHADAARPFERARCELAYGELLRRTRRRVKAREQLRAALDTFETLGATLWAERARVELRASGQTARKRDPSTRTRSPRRSSRSPGLSRRATRTARWRRSSSSARARSTSTFVTSTGSSDHFAHCPRPPRSRLGEAEHSN